MYSYKIEWRCDEEEYFCTESEIFVVQKLIDLFEIVTNIEKDNTVLLIERL